MNYEKAETEENRLTRLCRLINIGVFVSFIGWCFEKLSQFIIYGTNADRGFLTLPLCPIYGISVILIYLFCGTPVYLNGIIGARTRQTSLWQKLVKNKKWRKYLFYFVFVAVVSTLAELITGLTLKPFGITLWDYSDRAFNLWGIICPGFSLLWGALITLFMGVFWQRLYSFFSRISRYNTLRIALVLSVAVVADFTVNIILTVKNTF